MEDSKQTKNTVLSWALIGVAFVVIILFLLGKFITEGKESARTASQDKLIGHATSFADSVSSQVKLSEEYGALFAGMIKDGKGPDDKEIQYFANQIVEKTGISHILFCGKNVVDETGKVTKDIDISMFTGTETTNTIVNSDGNFCGEPAIVTCVPVGEGEQYIICVIHLEDMQRLFKDTNYEDVSFAVVANEKGLILGRFDRYKDADSMFLGEDNVFNLISQGVSSSEKYNVFKVKIYNKIGGAIETTYKGDARTVSVASIGVNDWNIVYGVRQSFVNKLIASSFASVKTTVIKLAIVIILFSVFIISTIVFNSLRFKEKGRVLEDKADTDLLTELNNKAATERKIQEYLSENPNSRAMMFILDIDNFKKINDTMGHAFGDTLLKTLGKEIKTEFRMTDIIGRTGGDEFMVFLKDVTDDLIVEREANRITRFFHDFKAGGDYVKYSASASIGAAIFPDDAKNFKDLYIAADQALYRAKKRGKNQLVFYNENIQNK